jgi:Na+/phosphate symporter
MLPLLNCDCFDFIGWHTVCQYSIEIERRTDCLCRIPAVASNHHDAGNAGSPQGLHSPGRLTPQLVGQQNCAYRALVERDEDTQR